MWKKKGDFYDKIYMVYSKHSIFFLWNNDFADGFRNVVLAYLGNNRSFLSALESAFA